MYNSSNQFFLAKQAFEVRFVVGVWAGPGATGGIQRRKVRQRVPADTFQQMMPGQPTTGLVTQVFRQHFGLIEQITPLTSRQFNAGADDSAEVTGAPLFTAGFAVPACLPRRFGSAGYLKPDTARQDLGGRLHPAR